MALHCYEHISVQKNSSKVLKTLFSRISRYFRPLKYSDPIINCPNKNVCECDSGNCSCLHWNNWQKVGLSWSPSLTITIVGPKAEPHHVFQKHSQCGFWFLYRKKFLLHILFQKTLKHPIWCYLGTIIHSTVHHPQWGWQCESMWDRCVQYIIEPWSSLTVSKGKGKAT